MSEIVTYLRGKTLLITGATGFLAKAVVEKILRCAPEVGRIYLVVRARRRKDGTTLTARERVEEEILQSAAFARLRETHGDRFADIMGARSTPSRAILPWTTSDWNRTCTAGSRRKSTSCSPARLP